MAGRPVYLDLEEDVMAQIARSAGQSDSDPGRALATAVRETVSLDLQGDRTFQEHVARAAAWEEDPADAPPPCIALLGFFSQVAEGMRSDETFRANNYYGRLSDALGIGQDDHRLRTKIQRDFRAQVSATLGSS